MELCNVCVKNNGNMDRLVSIKKVERETCRNGIYCIGMNLECSMEWNGREGSGMSEQKTRTM